MNNKTMLLGVIIATQAGCANVRDWDHRHTDHRHDYHVGQVIATSGPHPDPYAPPGLYDSGHSAHASATYTSEYAPNQASSLAPRDSHRVAPGETLYSIASAQGLRWQDVASWNGLTAPYTLLPGDQLTLTPNTSPSLIARSDSGWDQSSSTNQRPRYDRNDNQNMSPNRVSAFHRSDWQWPHPGPVIRSYQRTRATQPGVDLSGMRGDWVTAARGGQVIYAGEGINQFGQLVIIKHDNNYMSAYAYNKQLIVNEGEWIDAGQRIAVMGARDDGLAAVYFEVRRNGQPVDPASLLPAKRGSLSTNASRHSDYPLNSRHDEDHDAWTSHDVTRPTGSQRSRNPSW